MKVIALTGGIGTGKSTVSDLFKEKGVTVIDLDQLVRDLQKPGKDVYNRIVEAFGEEILDANGEIDRRKLGSIVFLDPEKRETLNKIVHPKVLSELKDRLFKLEKKGEKLIVVEIPLLYELGLQKLFDAVILVYAPEDLQIKRVMARDSLSKQEAINRINSQIPIEEKRKKAEYVIDNSGSLENTRQQFDVLFKELTEREVRV